MSTTRATVTTSTRAAPPRRRTFAQAPTVAPVVIYLFLLTSSKNQRTGRYSVDGFDFEVCGRELGLFAYLAHILRDVARDMRVGETGLVYLSREDMQRHNLNDEALRRFIEQGAGDQRWRALVKDMGGRAHDMEVRGTLMAEAQYSRIPPDCAFILCLIIRVYSDLLRRILAAPDGVLSGDPIPTTPANSVLVSVAKRTGHSVSRVLEKAAAVAGPPA